MNSLIKQEPLTTKKLEKIITSKKFNDLIGYTENDFFDAKECFYDFREPKNKHEICKDITAFANNSGGYLIIGCATNKLEESRIEYIKSAVGILEFPDLDQIKSILSDNIYPNSINEIIDFEKILLEDKKFFLIKINDIAEKRPYFVKKSTDNRSFFVFYRRIHDSGVREDIGYIHELAQQGIYFEKYLKNIIGANEKILNNTEKLIKKQKTALSLSSHYDIRKDL